MSEINWQRVILGVAAAGFLVAAITMRISFFAFALYAVGAVSLVSYIMTWSALDGLQTERHMTRRDAEIDEDLIVTVSVRNNKVLPTLWLITEDLVPDGLKTGGSTARATLLMPSASTRLQYRINCARRGYYRVGPVLHETGDFFGLNRRFATGESPLYLTVYPRIVPLERYAIPTNRPIGETVVKRRLTEDPTRLAGVREYHRGDPLRRIHTLIGANLVLDFGRAAWDTGDPDRAELAVTTVASIAAHLVDRKQQVGFITNGGDASDIIPDNHQSVAAPTRQRIHQLLARRERTERLTPVHIPVRRGEHQLLLLMRSLARLRLSDALTTAQLIAEEYESWPRDCATVVVGSERSWASATPALR